MGELLSHFKGYDIQATRREEREKTIKEMTEQITKEVTEKVRKEITDKVTQELTDKITQEHIIKFITVIKQTNSSKNFALAQLIEQYDFDEQEAQKLLEAYW